VQGKTGGKHTMKPEKKPKMASYKMEMWQNEQSREKDTEAKVSDINRNKESRSSLEMATLRMEKYIWNQIIKDVEL
jgi:hypothetical protein